MKIRLMLKINFLFILTITSLNAQWKSVSPGNYTWGTAWAIDACDSTTAVISVNGESGGRILLTTDAGKTWQNLNWPKINTYDQIIDISIIDPLHIWGAEEDGRIIATSDGGKTWQVQFENKNMTDFMNFVKMFNKNDGVAVGDATSDSEGSANNIFFLNENLGWAAGKFILKTTNGGITWTEENKIKPDFIGQNIFFIDQNNGWMSGDYQQGFYQTNDGGISWDSVKVIFKYPITYLNFFDDKNGFVLNSTSLTKTSDGGLSWRDISYSSWNAFNYVSFLSKDIGWLSYKGNLYSNPYTLLKTIDGGNTLQALKTFPNEEIISIYLADEKIGCVITKKGTGSTMEKYIYSTSDGGITWKVNNMGKLALTKFNFIPYDDKDAKKNYLIVGYYTDYIKISFDYGETWISNNSIFTSEVQCLNQNIWYCSTGYQRILKTTDGGTNWVKTAFEILPPSNAIFTTTNGGQNWIRSESNLTGCSSYDTWREIDFINKEEGFFCTSPYSSSTSSIYKTLDAGSNWVKTNFSRLTKILKFYNRNYGMWSAYKYLSQTQYTSLLFKTTDGGATFDSTDIGTTNVFDIEFLQGEPSKVWMSSTNGLYFSPDSGKTWVNGNLFTGTTYVWDIVFVNNRIGWALCNNRQVYRTENNGGLVTDIIAIERIPTKYFLGQNYPNPFNPTTILELSIPVEGFYSLDVFNILGEKISSLINGSLSPGIYKATFNGRDFSSGVYFYKLFGNNVNLVRKMMLIK